VHDKNIHKNSLQSDTTSANDAFAPAVSAEDNTANASVSLVGVDALCQPAISTVTDQKFTFQTTVTDQNLTEQFCPATAELDTETLPSSSHQQETAQVPRAPSVRSNSLTDFTGWMDEIWSLAKEWGRGVRILYLFSGKVRPEDGFQKFAVELGGECDLVDTEQFWA
jgi:hypothetical protein